MKYIIISAFSLYWSTSRLRVMSATLLITLCADRLTHALLRHFVKEMKDTTLRNCGLKEQRASAVFSRHFVQPENCLCQSICFFPSFIILSSPLFMLYSAPFLLKYLKIPLPPPQVFKKNARIIKEKNNKNLQNYR